MFKRRLFPALIFLGLAFATLLMSPSTNKATAAVATFQLGQWTFESTTDSSGAFYSTNGACIQAGGTWYATTSGQGSGRWYLKNSSLHLHGNYGVAQPGGGLNESFELTVINPNLLTGYAQEWNDSHSNNGYFRSKWTFVSATCAPRS